MDKSAEKIGIAIIGGTGYGARELLRLLTQHCFAEVVSVVSSSAAGEPIAKAHSHLLGFYPELSFDRKLNVEKLKPYSKKVVFVALPHGESAKIISEIISNKDLAGTKIIDLSGDFRLVDEKRHTEFYPETPFNVELRKKFVYGLPELNSEKISKAEYITNPGCYATTCALSVAPLIRAGLIDKVFFDAKSGTSGAGKNPSATFHHPERSSSFTAYKAFAHRHEPEILQTLETLTGDKIAITFVPHLLPISRGIFVTAHCELEKALSQAELYNLYQKFYLNHRFVRLRENIPEINDVVASNFCDISLTVRGKDLVCFAVLDNLVKGMAGQSIQNMNLMFGLNEATGLLAPALSIN